MKETFVLDGHTHAEAIKWLEAVSRKNGVKKFVFDLHYTLDSGAISDDFRFGDTTADALDTHAQYRDFTARACHTALTDLQLESEIRTWPHHFDTGCYAMVLDTEVGIGFGLSIPGSLCDDYYLYAAGYKDGNQISTDSLSALSKGKWVSGDWEGAVVPVSGLSEVDYLGFLKETLAGIRSVN